MKKTKEDEKNEGRTKWNKKNKEGTKRMKGEDTK
jgi:hypothetical protein